MNARQLSGTLIRRTRSHRNPWILMYHSVDVYQEDPYLLTVTPARFAAQMRWLERRRLRGVSVSELLQAVSAGTADGLVGLTFDDGYADFVENVLPVLKERGFTATVYVVAGLMSGTNTWDPDAPPKPLLSRDQVKSLSDAGIEIGSHSLNHRSVPSTTGAELTAELMSSREILQEVTGVPVTGFCYPYGDVNAESVAAVRSAGYEHACAIAHSDLPTAWALPRTYVGDRDNSLRLLAKLARHALRGWRRRATVHPTKTDDVFDLPTDGPDARGTSLGAAR
ncbi:polysaccharide deacetylase family protein [Streptacidiphilus pinicola]|uniref:Polysaccharide deacetylase family protein n=1 Tax=Streptacidiphilus pinicola TaxID=2219663 RepID=A0A2X0J5E0_9ACTN|nr:polysaccharide deacetylase family protein [Streptacidiphilus pinicola]RAG85486.1 polysaccharide deacetylase family protein [Streptacidiphilus pinicola]